MEKIKEVTNKYEELSEERRLLEKCYQKKEDYEDKLESVNNKLKYLIDETNSNYLTYINLKNEYENNIKMINEEIKQYSEVFHKLKKIKKDFISNLSNMLKKEIGESSSDLLYEILEDYSKLFTI